MLAVDHFFDRKPLDEVKTYHQQSFIADPTSICTPVASRYWLTVDAELVLNAGHDDGRLSTFACVLREEGVRHNDLAGSVDGKVVESAGVS